MFRSIELGAPIIFLASTILLNTPAHADATTNFVQAYLNANGGCGGAQSPLTFVLSSSGVASPFGKPAADWSQDDFSAMQGTLEQCAKAREASGRSSSEIRGDIAEIVSRLPAIVDRAKQARNARAKYEKGEAAQQALQRQAVTNFNEMQKQAWARTNEQLRNPHRADPCTVGVPSPYANLGPNGPAIREQFDRATDTCRLRMKEQAAAQNRMKQELAQRRERERIAALKADERHKTYLAEHNLMEVTVVDLQANGSHMIDKKITVVGFVKVFNEHKIVLYSHPGDINGVPLDLAAAGPSARRLIFANCSNIYTDCRIEIEGIVGFGDHVFIKVM